MGICSYAHTAFLALHTAFPCALETKSNGGHQHRAPVCACDGRWDTAIEIQQAPSMRKKAGQRGAGTALSSTTTRGGGQTASTVSWYRRQCESGRWERREVQFGQFKA